MNEQSIIVIGGNNVGKTTMIYRYLEKNENTIKPTIGIDYSFARKTGKSLTKSCTHIWEIGHLTASIIAAAITEALSIHSVNEIFLIIMIDLTKPETLWSTLENSLIVIRSAIKIAHSDDTIDQLKKSRLNELNNLTDELSIIDPLSYKCCIVGGKYDEFKKFKLSTKKLIGQTLRQVAFTTGSHLQYYSSKDSQLIRKMRDLFSHCTTINSNNNKKEYCCDYEQPLMIPAGSETLNDIHLNNYSSTQSKSIIDVIKHFYLSEFPDNGKGNEEKKIPDDPIHDPNFYELIIDNLLSQREEEIELNLQEMMEGKLPKPIINDPL